MGKSDALSRRADDGTGGEIQQCYPTRPEFFAATPSAPSLDCHQKEERDILRDIRSGNPCAENRRMQLEGG